MAGPRVSVAIATYNGARYLRAQLDSIFLQTYPAYEVVVTDDGSTDETLSILEDYARRYPLRYQVNPKRLGFVQNFGEAFRSCEGELICPSDQDDVWDPLKLQTQVAALGDASLVYSPARRQMDADGEIHKIVLASNYLKFLRSRGSGRRVVELAAENWVTCHSLLMRKEVVEEALPIPAGQSFHDAWIAVVAAAQRGIQWLEADLLIYRKHAGSVTFAGDQPEPRSWKQLVLPDSQQELAFQELCRKQTARLRDIHDLGLLNPKERYKIEHLLELYDGKRSVPRFQAAYAALRTAHQHITVSPGARGVFRLAFKALLGRL